MVGGNDYHDNHMEENLGPKELDGPDKEDENRGLREGDALL